MQVTILSAFGDDEECKVVFRCAQGEGVGDWQGRRPQPGDLRFVEFDLPSPLVVGRDLRDTVAALGLTRVGDSTRVVGLAVSSDVDGNVCLDIGGAFLDVMVREGRLAVGGRYEATVAGLRLFDENL